MGVGFFVLCGCASRKNYIQSRRCRTNLQFDLYRTRLAAPERSYLLVPILHTEWISFVFMLLILHFYTCMSSMAELLELVSLSARIRLLLFSCKTIVLLFLINWMQGLYTHRFNLKKKMDIGSRKTYWRHGQACYPYSSWSKGLRFAPLEIQWSKPHAQ